MQKLYTSKEPLEFYINNKWQQGELHNINIPSNTFKILLSQNKSLISHQSTSLQINTINIQNILSNSSNSYNVNDKVEFYDENTKGWIEGSIKSIKGDFFVINYNIKNNFDNSKIIYKNNLRPTTKEQDIIKLSMDCINCYELKDKFKELSNPEKCAKKLSKEIIEIFGKEIKYIFLGENLEMFILKDKKLLNNNSLLKSEIIEELIKIAVKHFEEIEQNRQKVLK